MGRHEICEISYMFFGYVEGSVCASVRVSSRYFGTPGHRIVGNDKDPAEAGSRIPEVQIYWVSFTKEESSSTPLTTKEEAGSVHAHGMAVIFLFWTAVKVSTLPIPLKASRLSSLV